MTKHLKLSGLALAISATLAFSATSAQAYQAGDMIGRAGFATVAPNTDSGKLKANGSLYSSANPVTVDLDNNTQLGLTLTYMLTDNIGIELLAATPFSHTLKTKGGLVTKLADVKHLPPTLSVQYYPMEASSVWQPYIGAGLNYTVFFDESLKGDNKTTFKSLELEDSIGLAFQAGVDYALTDTIGLNAAVWWIDIDTEGTFKSADGTTKFKIDVEIDPWVYMVGLNYKF